MARTVPLEAPDFGAFGRPGDMAHLTKRPRSLSSAFDTHLDVGVDDTFDRNKYFHSGSRFMIQYSPTDPCCAESESSQAFLRLAEAGLALLQGRGNAFPKVGARLRDGLGYGFLSSSRSAATRRVGRPISNASRTSTSRRKRDYAHCVDSRDLHG
jgi:hypothetical protein